MKVFLAIASYQGLTDAYGRARNPHFSASLIKSIELLKSAGHDVLLSKFEGSCYVQLARNELISIFMGTDFDTLVFLDDDLSWDAKDLLKLIEMTDEIVCGVYRRKKDEEDYPVVIRTDANNRPLVRPDGCIAGYSIPAGFMVIKRSAIEALCKAYPQLEYENYDNGERKSGVFFDLFPQGVKDRRWVGEDFAFCRLWTDICGDIWVVPNMTLHHYGHGKCFTGNYHEYLMRQPGGANENKRADRELASRGA